MGFKKGYTQTPEHIRKRIAARKAHFKGYFKSDYVVWNKGETKETHAGLLKLSQTNIKGRKIHTARYILVYKSEHPSCDRDGYVFEHRIIAERKLGRYLYDFEYVHHINHDKQDNRPENLQIVTAREHALLHMQKLVRQAHTPAATRKRIATNLQRYGDKSGKIHSLVVLRKGAATRKANGIGPKRGANGRFLKKQQT